MDAGLLATPRDASGAAMLSERQRSRRKLGLTGLLQPGGSKVGSSFLGVAPSSRALPKDCTWSDGDTANLSALSLG